MRHVVTRFYRPRLVPFKYPPLVLYFQNAPLQPQFPMNGLYLLLAGTPVPHCHPLFAEFSFFLAIIFFSGAVFT
jgi:hypothetical protein